MDRRDPRPLLRSELETTFAVYLLALTLFVAEFAAVRVCRTAPEPVSPGAWVVTEAVRARVLFGGLPWGRLAFGQTDGPLLPLASLAVLPGDVVHNDAVDG
ncbi:hypothetical protein ACFWCF_11140 [Rhodococcus sp. NPDC060090]|uniref:hypothetical protein n=1 Tax=Rhodococcus sp. NPDC060090 TaxID=3347056 RepID=UPI00364C5E26